jgi:hypothetical protein
VGSGGYYPRGCGLLRLPLPIIPPISPSPLSSGAGTIVLIVAAMPSGPNWTPLPTFQLKNTVNHHARFNNFDYTSFGMPTACMQTKHWRQTTAEFTSYNLTGSVATPLTVHTMPVSIVTVAAAAE